MKISICEVVVKEYCSIIQWLVLGWEPIFIGRIKCCEINNNGWWIKGSLGADDDVPVLELVDLPCADATVSAAPLIQNKIKTNQDQVVN